MPIAVELSMMKQLTIPEAAKETGLNERTLRLWAKTGRLRHKIVGGMYFVKVSDIKKIGTPKRGRPQISQNSA